MSPFIEPERLSEIFGANLFEKDSLLEDFKKLIGLETEKPFECVGSRDEINFALCEVIKKYDKLPVLLDLYRQTELFVSYSARKNPYNDFYDTTNLLPDRFEKMLKDELNREDL